MKGLTEQDLTPDPIHFGRNGDLEMYIHYTSEFKYLGSRLTQDLSDEREINYRIQQATAQVMALMNFWNSKSDLETKRIIFMALLMQTVLYGCEYWTLTDQLRGKLSTFQHKSMRRVLGINMHDVQELHIKNAQVRSKMCLDNILDTITWRQMSYIGKLARMGEHRLPRRMMGAWIRKKRPKGGQPSTIARTHVKAMQEVLGTDAIDLHAQFREWFHRARSPDDWDRPRRNWLALKRRAASGTGALGEPIINGWTEQADPSNTSSPSLITHAIIETPLICLPHHSPCSPARSDRFFV